VGRRFGQHFLNRQSILDRIARAACGDDAGPEDACPEAARPDRVPLVLEIGPGKGALTACLIERARKLVAIEVDTVLVHYLRQRFHDAVEAGRLILVEGDILRTDLTQWGPAVLAGNLPYYITSPILARIFEAPQAWTRAVFLVQAEVAARLAASPGSRDYGYLSVLAQVHARVEVLFDVSRVAFKPPPKVDSAVVRLEPRDAGNDFGLADPAAFLRFASACFRQKRKTLRNNLRTAYPAEQVDALPEAGLRAEQLGIAELASIFSRLSDGTMTRR
jgi:16S rRNA (adenine1518-N6/adenine1519-N6)-dimethyltransferase